MGTQGGKLQARDQLSSLAVLQLSPIQPKQERHMEIIIELTEAELDAVAGGTGSASFTFSNSASGTNATISGTFHQSTTASSASQSGSFSSSST
jgi:hypothetical protein